ncbi:hypothetical protein QR680_008066 [Steinernema hermaphroditum]|uniref:Protein kinase domain-containing protein n=1 Tax=Steinernema hermaphroditum TaxID=289476 RepID=A0AA39M766_9BILA|nr:hypothetical protein QR680_008066 [Steinernema hermaphroditum]
MKSSRVPEDQKSVYASQQTCPSQMENLSTMKRQSGESAQKTTTRRQSGESVLKKSTCRESGESDPKTATRRESGESVQKKTKRHSGEKSVVGKTVPPSPLIYSPATLRKAAEGVRKDIEKVAVFDPIFYTNKVPMNEHDATRRPKWGTKRNKSNYEAERVYRVRAREVGEVDRVQRLIVRQVKYCGSGAFSDVYIGYVQKESEPEKKATTVAIKKIWPDPSKEEEQIVVQRCFNHQNILKLLYYYVCVHPTTKVTMWSMILELMPSTVSKEHHSYIERGKLMPEIYIKVWSYQLFCGLYYLERCSVFHRDIKPENLLVDKDSGRLKIADFGACKKYRAEQRNHSYHVTRYYRAPELCLKYDMYDPTIDVWSAGCIVAELLMNRILFPGRNSNDQLKQIIRVLGTPSVKDLKGCVPGKNVPESVFKPVVPKRGFMKIIHRYNRNVSEISVEFVDLILQYDCNKRLRGKAALAHQFFDNLRSPKTKMPSGQPLPPLQYINYDANRNG